MIEAIYVAAEDRGIQRKLEQVSLIAHSGIVGDRNFNKTKWPGQNITFIEKEEIDNFNLVYGQSIDQDAPRRNIITSGVRLNDLVGKEFEIGAVKFLGVSLCEPCMLFAGDLENETISRKDVAKAFLRKGGLRADILTDGVISVGMTVIAVDALWISPQVQPPWRRFDSC